MIKKHQILDLFGKNIFEKAVLEPPFRIMAEMPNEACFYYVVEGEATVYAPTEKLITPAKEGMVLKCGNYLNEYLTTNESNRCEAVAVHLYPDVLKMIYDRDLPDFLTEAPAKRSVDYQRIAGSDSLKSYIDSLQFYFENPNLVSEELLKLKLKELILLLVKTDKADAIKSLIASLFSPAELDFKEVIEANIFNNLGLEDLAKLTHLSLSSFKREFVKHYETSPAKYIRQRKLEKAAKLLKGTDLRITDIAFDCGFVDLAHFSKCFQKEYGLTPSEFRLNQNDKSLGRNAKRVA